MIFFFFSPHVFAAEEFSSKSITSDLIKSDPMSGSYLTQLVLGLLVVILCIVALAWFAKKMNRFHSVTNDSLKIISGISIGTRERILLLQVGDEQVLVGAAPGNINKLHVLKTPISNHNVMSTDDGTNHTDNGFANKLKKMIANVDAVNKKKKL